MMSKVSIAAFYHRLLRMVTNLADTLPGHNREITASAGKQAHGLRCASRYARNTKRKKEGSASPAPTISSRKRQKHVRNKHADSDSGHDTESEDEPDEPDELEGAETEMRQIRICDVLKDYYEVAFRCINQLCCKDISKAWIHLGQPRKQTSHPYNGGKSSVERSKEEHDYLGHYSMPDYWPSDANWKAGWGCRHREPDHVKKAGQSVCELVPTSVLTSHLERLILLIHLLRSQGKGYQDGDFSIEKLRRATAGIHLKCVKNWKSEYVDRLEEIYWVREKEMEFERGEIGWFSSVPRRDPFGVNVASDEDTLVSVRMPKPRCKNRKASKSSVKAKGPSGEQIKREPGERGTATCNAPTANMGISLQIQVDDLDPSESSEPSISAETSSSTEEVAADTSCPEPTLSEARTIQHGASFSMSPTESRRSSVKENWTPQSVNLGQDPNIFTHPTPFGSVAPPSEAQKAMPTYDQSYFASSSMQSLPNQDFVRRQFEHESHQTFIRNLPARPLARKAESIHHQAFAASSTGLAGVWPPIDASWQPNDYWNAQVESSMYTTVDDPSVSLLPSTNGSSSSGYSDATYSTGMPLDAWNDGNQGLLAPYSHGLGEDLNQNRGPQEVRFPEYQADTSSGGNLESQLLYTTGHHTNISVGSEHKFGRPSQSQQRF